MTRTLITIAVVLFFNIPFFAFAGHANKAEEYIGANSKWMNDAFNCLVDTLESDRVPADKDRDYRVAFTFNKNGDLHFVHIDLHPRAEKKAAATEVAACLKRLGAYTAQSGSADENTILPYTVWMSRKSVIRAECIRKNNYMIEPWTHYSYIGYIMEREPDGKPKRAIFELVYFDDNLDFFDPTKPYIEIALCESEKLKEEGLSKD